MKCNIVLLLIAVFFVAFVKSSVLHRQERQTWEFPQETNPSVDIPARPTGMRRTTTRSTTAATPTTTTPRPGVSTSTAPTGVIFLLKNCDCPAPPQFNPVCGTDGNTYVNRQKLLCAQRCGYDVQEARMGAC